MHQIIKLNSTMKKSLLLIAALFVFSAGYANSTSKYYVNDDQVETLMEESVQVQFDNSIESPFGVASIQADKNVWIAVALAWFVGGFGVHRVYLDGKASLIAIYIFTGCGIFGIVPLVDFFALIINNDDISKYIGNDKFFMWAK